MTDLRTETLARATFAVLVVATFAAFFVTQRLKHQSPVVQQVRMNTFFSPLGKTHPVERISFKLTHADVVTVTVIDSRGDDVATLLRDRHLPRYLKWRLTWNGRNDSGPLAPDGTYQIRIRLRRQARTIVPNRSFVLHTAPPTPRITQIAGPAGTPTSGPAILPEPGGVPAKISFSLDGGRGAPQLLVYKTDVSPPRLVTTLPVAAGATSASWNGTIGGRPAASGTYLVAIRVTDRYGNVGQTPAALPTARGAVVPGHAGITVRYLGVEPPVTAVAAERPIVFGVDARRSAYSWSVTRVGFDRPRAGGRSSAALLRIRAPGGPSGLYVLTLRSAARTATVPFAVEGGAPQRILVVLPQITWLGEDNVDDDGDGLPNTLSSGRPVRAQRIYAGSGLPAGFAGQVGPAFAFLARHRLHYDVTTDLALAEGAGPPLRGHAGVALIGDERWLPAGVARQLRAFLQNGGNIASLGTDSLLRTVTLAGGELSDPSGPAQTDAFGASLEPLAGSPGPITDYLDRIGLFGGGTGQFAGYSTYQATLSVGSGAELLASAVTPRGRPVVVAVRYGRGLLVRTGLPDFASRLGSDQNAAALLERIWALLSS